MEIQENLYAQVEAARATISAQSSITPRIGLILGSGLSALADDMQQPQHIAYRDIPGFAIPSIAGHRDYLALGTLGGQAVAALCGRLHFYEGYSMQQITFPVRVLRALGCDILIITNAAGGLNPAWNAGDIMCIMDQLFLPGMVGFNPLRGPHDERLGERFPAIVGAFDADLEHIATAAAGEVGQTLRRGVYAMVSGPNFESAAELRMLHDWGADAVGMSTAPEVVVACQAGMRVLGLSLLSNMASPGSQPASHHEVLEVGGSAYPAFAALLERILQKIEV